MIRTSLSGIIHSTDCRTVGEYAEAMTRLGWPGSASIKPRKHTQKIFSKSQSEAIKSIQKKFSRMLDRDLALQEYRRHNVGKDTE